MFYCNDLLSLSVLSLYEGELIGVVDKLYFDKKLKKLVEVELIGEDGAKMILPTKNIYKVGKNAITIKNNQMISLKIDESNLSLCPINSKAFSIAGEYLGIVKEINIDAKFNTEKICLDNNKTLELSKLASFGKNTIIFYDNQQNENINKFTPSKITNQIKQQKEVEVNILPTPKIENKDSVAMLKTADFLVGRICIKDIFNFNNELLIKANSVVNKKHLKEIKKFGKLRELMLWCK